MPGEMNQRGYYRQAVTNSRPANLVNRGATATLPSTKRKSVAEARAYRHPMKTSLAGVFNKKQDLYGQRKQKSEKRNQEAKERKTQDFPRDVAPALVTACSFVPEDTRGVVRAPERTPKNGGSGGLAG
jgi:hypothetical protein